MNVDDIWSLSPSPFREGQKEAIESICQALDDGYENIILEAGTGTGKSAIGTSVINYVNNSFLVTKTKQLQQQYIDTFPQILTNIKGRKNYQCNYNIDDCYCYIDYVNKKNLIDEKLEILELSPTFDTGYLESLDYDEQCVFLTPMKMWNCHDCPYQRAVKKAKISDNVLSNYDYLWYSSVINKIFPSRQLLVVDEAHTLEQKIMSFVTFTLNSGRIFNKYDIDIFNDRDIDDITSISYWIDIYYQIIAELQYQQEISLEEVSLKIGDNDLLEKEIIQGFDKLCNKYYDIIEELKTHQYVVNVETSEEKIRQNYYDLTVELKPVYPVSHIKRFLSLGTQRLFMTATLGDKYSFCKYLGLNEDDTFHYVLKSPFKKENRPIITKYAGYFSGSKNNIPNWKNDNSIRICQSIILHHHGENGIIHTNSNNQTNYLYEKLYPLFSNHYNFYCINEDNNRDLMIKRFIDDKKPSILIGASIKDGVDFEGDLCRFQICAKMPYLYVGDNQIKVRQKQDLNWYYYHTAVDLLQSYGRGIRSENDFCTFYIIDAAFKPFFKYNRNLLGEYFLEALNIPIKHKSITQKSSLLDSFKAKSN